MGNKMLPLVTFYLLLFYRKLLISGEITHVLHKVSNLITHSIGNLLLLLIFNCSYYVRFKTSLLIQLITCFYYSHSIGNPFLSLLIDDVTQLFLLRMAKNLC